MFDLVWHFPYHLVSLQLLVFMCFTELTAERTLRRFRTCISLFTPPDIWSCIAEVVATTSFAISLPLWTQALLHLENTPTLVLLSPLAFLGSFLLSAENRSADWSTLLRVCLAQAAITVIVVCDYRFTVFGIIFGLASFAIFGISTATLRAVNLQSLVVERKLCQTFGLPAALLSSLILAFVFEDSPTAFSWFTSRGIVAWSILVINLASTSVAFYTGGSIVAFFPGTTDSEEVCCDTNVESWSTYAVTLIITSIFSISRTEVISPYQIMGFLVAAACLERNLFQIAEHGRSGCIKDPQSAGTFDLLGTKLGLNLPDAASSYESLASSEDSIEIGDPWMRRKNPSTCMVKLALTLATIVCLATCIFYSVLDVFPASPTTRSPSLDTAYRPTSMFDIVISMYDEPITDLQQTISLVTKLPAVAARNPRVSVYLKDASVNISAVRAAISSYKGTVTVLPNVGREGETYLNHILTHWNDLANHTLFLQAETHNPRESMPRLRDYFFAETGMLSLSHTGATCDCNDTRCYDRYWSDNSGLVQEIYLTANNLTVCPSPKSKILLSYKGQFVASAARIRGIDKSIYQRLHNFFTDGTAYVHQPKYLDRVDDMEGVVDQMSRPVFGFAMERMWSAVLQCSDEEVARRCPSLYAGWRTGGRRSDCQCLDI